MVFHVLRKAGFEEGAEGDGENLKFESNNSSAAVLFETDMTRLDMARYATWCTRSSRGWVHKEFFTMY